jgi:hypothetical protein
MKKVYLLGILVLSVCLLVSCEQPSDDSRDPAAAAAKVELAETALQAGDYATAKTHYEAALQLDSECHGATLGLAIVNIIIVSEETMASADGVMGDMSAMQSMNLEGNKRFSIFENAAKASSYSSFSIPKTLSEIAIAATSDPETFKDIQDIIEADVIPVFDLAITQIRTLETSDFNYTLIIEEEGETIVNAEFDAGEAYCLDAFLCQMLIPLDLIVAYNIDISSSAMEDPMEVLNSTTFLVLNSYGTARLADAHDRLLELIAAVRAGVNFICAETDNQDNDLIPNTELLDQKTDILAELDDMETSFSGPADVDDGQGGTVTIDISSFFNSPITDLKTIFPNNITGFDVNDEPIIDGDPTWDDPTLNGLLPGMTDAELATLMELP